MSLKVNPYSPYPSTSRPQEGRISTGRKENLEPEKFVIEVKRGQKSDHAKSTDKNQAKYLEGSPSNTKGPRVKD